jgi:adenine-specific DNA-methyltransferase
MHDHILVYGKNKNALNLNLIPRTAEANKRYKNPDNDLRGPWKSSDLSVKTYAAKNDYPISTPVGRVVNPPKSTCWRFSKEKYEELVTDGRIYFGVNGDATPSIKRFLSEVQQGTPPQTIWDYSEVGHNQEARKEILALFEDADFATPKPERLLQRIIHIGTNKDDIVLDFFAGSGTTAAVAMKMSRKFITSEQMDYVDTVTTERIKKVIKGEQGGISSDVHWNGGSSFVYMELMKANLLFIERIELASDTETILTVWQQVIDDGLINHLLEPDILSNYMQDFNSLSLIEQKTLLIEMIDKNQLYVNLSEIEDIDYSITEKIINLNGQFYYG